MSAVPIDAFQEATWLAQAEDRFDVVWPLHRDHYLTVPNGEHETSPDVTQMRRYSDYRTIIEACDGEWRSLREIAERTESSNLANVSQNLKRAVEEGILKRKRVEFPWRTYWGYRKV